MSSANSPDVNVLSLLLFVKILHEEKSFKRLIGESTCSRVTQVISSCTCTNSVKWRHEAYQHVDSAAHAMLRTLVVRDCAVRQEILQQAAQQKSQLLSGLWQVSVASAVVQQPVHANKCSSQTTLRQWKAILGLAVFHIKISVLQFLGAVLLGACSWGVLHWLEVACNSNSPSGHLRTFSKMQSAKPLLF